MATARCKGRKSLHAGSIGCGTQTQHGGALRTRSAPPPVHTRRPIAYAEVRAESELFYLCKLQCRLMCKVGGWVRVGAGATVGDKDRVEVGVCSAAGRSRWEPGRGLNTVNHSPQESALHCQSWALLKPVPLSLMACPKPLAGAPCNPKRAKGANHRRAAA